MKVYIKDKSERWSPVCVVVDGYCNHADSRMDELDGGHYDAQYADWLDDWRKAEICNRCNAWYDNVNDEWIGEINETVEPAPIFKDIFNMHFGGVYENE